MLAVVVVVAGVAGAAVVVPVLEVASDDCTVAKGAVEYLWLVVKEAVAVEGKLLVGVA